MLTSQRRQRPVAFSLTTPTPAPTAGETAITELLRVVRSPRAQALGLGPMNPLSRAPTFLSGGLPRDRRGRIAQKSQSGKDAAGMGGEEEERYREDAARSGGPVHGDGEREREFLEALRWVFCILVLGMAVDLGIGVRILRVRLLGRVWAAGVWVQAMKIMARRWMKKKRTIHSTGIKHWCVEYKFQQSSPG